MQLLSSSISAGGDSYNISVFRIDSADLFALVFNTTTLQLDLKTKQTFILPWAKDPCALAYPSTRAGEPTVV
jgi:hypothetical protein